MTSSWMSIIAPLGFVPIGLACLCWSWSGKTKDALAMATKGLLVGWTALFLIGSVFSVAGIGTATVTNTVGPGGGTVSYSYHTPAMLQAVTSGALLLLAVAAVAWLVAIVARERAARGAVAGGAADAARQRVRTLAFGIALTIVASTVVGYFLGQPSGWTSQSGYYGYWNSLFAVLAASVLLMVLWWVGRAGQSS